MNVGKILIVIMLAILLISFVVSCVFYYTKLHKSNIPQTKYAYKITFKNKAEEKGKIIANNVKQAGEILLNSQYNVTNKGKKITYYNSNEIQTFYIEEIKD